jgi:hypothetical protein
LTAVATIVAVTGWRPGEVAVSLIGPEFFRDWTITWATPLNNFRFSALSGSVVLG